jgi:hypothetical protein
MGQRGQWQIEHAIQRTPWLERASALKQLQFGENGAI